MNQKKDSMSKNKKFVAGGNVTINIRNGARNCWPGFWSAEETKVVRETAPKCIKEGSVSKAAELIAGELPGRSRHAIELKLYGLVKELRETEATAAVEKVVVEDIIPEPPKPEAEKPAEEVGKSEITEPLAKQMNEIYEKLATDPEGFSKREIRQLDWVNAQISEIIKSYKTDW